MIASVSGSRSFSGSLSKRACGTKYSEPAISTAETIQIGLACENGQASTFESVLPITGVQASFFGSGASSAISAGSKVTVTARLMIMPAPEIRPSSAMPRKSVGTNAKKPSEQVSAQTVM